MKTIQYDETKWQLVPKEPTEKQLSAKPKRVGVQAQSVGSMQRNADREKYIAMIESALEAPAQPVLSKHVGYFNIKYGTFFKLSELAGTERNRDLIKSGEIVEVYAHTTQQNVIVDAAPVAQSVPVKADQDATPLDRLKVIASVQEKLKATGFAQVQDVEMPIATQNAIDAARYRWLRYDVAESKVPRVWRSDENAAPTKCLTGSKLDSEIDAAMQAKGGES